MTKTRMAMSQATRNTVASLAALSKNYQATGSGLQSNTHDLHHYNIPLVLADEATPHMELGSLVVAVVVV